MQNTKVEDDKKKRRALLLLLLLLLIAASLYWFLLGGRGRQESLIVNVKEESISLSTFDSEDTRVEALLNNLIVILNDNTLFLDPSLGRIEDGQFYFVDGDLSIHMTDMSQDGEVLVTVTFQDLVATITFNVDIVSPRRSTTTSAQVSDPVDETPAPSNNDSGIGNVIDAPAEISPIRDINNEVAETPEDKNTNEEVSDTNVVVDPVDVATPVNNPDTNQEQTPEVVNISYNKVSIIFDNGESLSLFSSNGSGKLVIMFKDGMYINAASGNRVDFSVGGEDVITFGMTEYNASGSAIATSSGNYSK